MGEFEDGWGNASGLTEASAWGVERVTDKGYFADTSIRVTKTQKNSFAAVIQEVWLEAGTYTLSVYAFVRMSQRFQTMHRQEQDWQFVLRISRWHMDWNF